MRTRLRALHLTGDRFVTALRDAWDAGDAVVPLAVDATEDAVQRLLAAMRPELLVTGSVGGDDIEMRHLDDPAPIDGDVALVVTTSGSTGHAKGVELTHDALSASTGASIARLGCRAGERWGLALPVHHVAGIQVVLRSWVLGTQPVLVGTGGVGALRSAGADHVSLVPTQLRRLLDQQCGTTADTGRFRTILLGGARADPALLARARTAGSNVVVSYGMTETGGGCVYDGIPLDGVEIRLREDARIQIRGPVLFRGYRLDPAGTDAAADDEGWFTSGDHGRIVDGRLEVLGRADDVIVSGGENVPAEVVRTSLLRHSKVGEVAVVGQPDDEWGEVVVAVVVPADTDDPPEVASLREHVRADHPPAYAPRRLLVVDTLPVNGMGKVTRASVRAAIDAAAQRGG